MRLFVILALAVAIGLATAVSPFASASPDGLEKVADDKAFIDDGRLHSLQDDSPIPDYAFPGVENERVATGLAGLRRHAARVRLRLRARRRRRAPQADDGMSAGHLHAAGVAGDPASPIHRLDPRAKLIGFAGVTLVAVSTPLTAWPAYVACAARADRCSPCSRACARGRCGRAAGRCSRSCCSSRSSCRSCARATRSTLGPVTVSEQGLATFATVSAKAILGTLSAVLLGATTSFPDVLHALERLRAPRLLVADRGLHVPLPVRDRRGGHPHARRARRPRLRAAPRAPGRGHRPRRHRALPAHLRARRARPPGDARARLEPGDAAPGRARLPPRRRALPRRARLVAGPRAGDGAHELRRPRDRAALRVPERRRRRSTASTCTSPTASASPSSAPTAPARRR